jgi:hypothetical protein
LFRKLRLYQSCSTIEGEEEVSLYFAYICNFLWFYSVPKGKYWLTTLNYDTTTSFCVLIRLLTTTIPLLNAIHTVVTALSLKMWYKYISKMVSALHESTQSNPSQTSLLKAYTTLHCTRTQILSANIVKEKHNVHIM